MSDTPFTLDHVPGAKSRWRFYPWALAGAMLFVFAVNGAMIWSALTTFPGPAVNSGFGSDDDDSFEVSNNYDHVLAAVDRQKALGWSVAADALGARPVLHLTDKAGHPLGDASVVVTAIRPLGPSARSHLTFGNRGNGDYVAEENLPWPGQWDLLLRVTHAGNEMRVTRRILVR